MTPDRPPPRRVFLSHTAELRLIPSGYSFVDAAERAVIWAGDAVVDMEYFGPRDEQPSEVCRREVQACHIFVMIAGFRYGSKVRDMPDRSYMEWEFECATEARLQRLVFLLSEDTRALSELLVDPEDDDRQAAWRARLRPAFRVIRLG